MAIIEESASSWESCIIRNGLGSSALINQLQALCQDYLTKLTTQLEETAEVLRKLLINEQLSLEEEAKVFEGQSHFDNIGCELTRLQIVRHRKQQ